MSTAENIALTKSYIRDALFSLMAGGNYESISISDIVKKAGVGRATFYRHYRTKDEIIQDYFAAKTENFTLTVFPNSDSYDTHYEIVFTAFSFLKREKQVFKTLIAAHMEHIYLEFLNKMLTINFADHHYLDFPYAPLHYAGSLYNVSLEWVRRDCAESVKQITDGYVGMLFGQK